MSVIKYIGRKTDFKGKTLWEILANLKNFGVNRIVTRSMFERYPEPCFIKILKVEALRNNEDIRKVKVTVEKTFRGRLYPKVATIYSVSYKADYRLIPKEQELDYCKCNSKSSEKIIPATIDLPPLLREFVQDENEKNLKIKTLIKPSRDNFYRIAKEGEAPTTDISMGLGKPASLKLYENIILESVK